MSDRYGNRRVSKMLAEWNRLREAVREGNLEGIQNAFDACEEWIDFAFGQNKGEIKAQAAEIERLRGALQWCSGSADFNEGGIAREGWLTLCAPLLTGGKP